MKKQNLFYVLLALAVCFISCDNGNEPNPDNEGDKPTEILLRKITYEFDDRTINAEFTYDNQNRLTKYFGRAPFTTNDGTEDVDFYMNFSYSEKEINVSGRHTGSFYGNYDVVLKLNNDKYIESENWTFENYKNAWNMTYEYGTNGKLEKSFTSNNDRNRTHIFEWLNGNMIKHSCEETGQKPWTDSFEYSTYSYAGDIDINRFLDNITGDFPLVPYLTVFYGKPNKNLISKSGDASFEYEISEDNYVTKCIVSSNGEAYRTLLFEYK